MRRLPVLSGVRWPVLSVGVQGMGISPLSFLLRLLEFCCLRQFAWAQAGRCKTYFLCAPSQLPLSQPPQGLLPTCMKAMSKCYRFSHLFNSQNPNALGLELEHKLLTCAKDGRQGDGGLCPPTPVCACMKNPYFFLIFQTSRSELCSWADGSFTSIQPEKWLHSSLPTLTKVVALLKH